MVKPGSLPLRSLLPPGRPERKREILTSIPIPDSELQQIYFKLASETDEISIFNSSSI